MVMPRRRRNNKAKAEYGYTTADTARLNPIPMNRQARRVHKREKRVTPTERNNKGGLNESSKF